MSTMDMLKSRQDEKFTNFKQVVSDSLEINEVIAHIISENENVITFSSYNGNLFIIQMGTTVDKKLGSIDDYNVEFYKRDGEDFELIGKKHRDNPIDIAELIIRFTRSNY